jgi:hypothetical protein
MKKKKILMRDKIKIKILFKKILKWMTKLKIDGVDILVQWE